LVCFSLLSQTETQKKSNDKSSSTKTKSTTKDTLQGGHFILFNTHDPKPLCYWKIRGLVQESTLKKKKKKKRFPLLFVFSF
jgi:hypothetical protein